MSQPKKGAKKDPKKDAKKDARKDTAAAKPSLRRNKGQIWTKAELKRMEALSRLPRPTDAAKK